MNGNIGTLTIEMAANVARLQQGMEQANRIIGRTMGGIEHMAGIASTALGMIGVGLSVAGIVAFGNRGIDMLAQLDDAAQKTGASVENLSKIQRVTTELNHDFAAVESSIIKLAKGMATFDSETNYTSRALKTLGINSRDAAGNLRDPSQVLVEIAKNLQDYQDGAAKSALVMDLFGKSGAELLPVLNDIADNVDRFGPISAEAAAQAAQFQDQMSSLRARVDDAVMSFATGLFPALTRITASTRDAGEGMSIFNRAGRAVGDMFVWLLEKASAAWMIIGNFGDMAGTTGRQMLALLKGDFAEVARLEKNLDNEMGKRLAEHQYYVSRITGGNTEIAESAEKVKKSLNYQTGTQSGVGSAASDYERATKAAADYITRLQQETEAIGLNAIQVKLLAAARAAAAAPLQSQRMEIMASAQAWAEATVAQEENAEAAKRLEAEEKKRLDGYAALVQADEKALESLKQKNDLLQFGAEAVGKMGQADLQAALDRAWAADNIDVNVINMLERRLELSKQLASEVKRGEALQAAKDAAKAASDAWQQTARDINRSLTDALLRGFESGKGFLKNFRDTAVNMFSTLVLRPVISGVLAPVTGALGGLVPGSATAGTGGMGVGIGDGLSLGSSLFSTLGGGLTSGLSSAVSGLGSLFGSSAVSAFGAGMGMSGTAAAGAAGAYGAAGMASTGTAITMGSAAAALAGPLAIAAIADIGLRMLAGNKTISDNKVWKTLSAIPLIGILPNAINALFGAGPKKFGPAELTGEFLGDGFHGEFQTDWTRKLGLFGIGKKRGRRGLGIDPEQLDAVNNMLFGITDSIQEFIKSTGDQERSLDGWTFAVKHQIETEEQQAQLSLEIANSLGAHLIPELVQLQQKNETLVETMGRVRAEFTLTEQIIDLTGQTFSKVGLASLALRDSLVQHLGGLQNAGSLLQPFFEGFYTDAERAASTGRLMNAELAKLGVTTIPQTREQFRALVEAQDLNTEAGQEMFAALLRLAPAFASVTDAMGQAAADAEAEAKRILDSMQLLTTDAFSTLFDYTKYIRLAANAGVTAAQPAQVFQAPPAKVFPSFAVGTNSLPQDMTINAHAGERIIPAADNRELMQRLREPNEATKIMADEIKQLRSEMKAAHLAIARNTANTAKILGRWDGNGIPEERVTA